MHEFLVPLQFYFENKTWVDGADVDNCPTIGSLKPSVATRYSTHPI